MFKFYTWTACGNSAIVSGSISKGYASNPASEITTGHHRNYRFVCASPSVIRFARNCSVTPPNGRLLNYPTCA